LLLSYLLLCNIPMFSIKLKSFSWGENKLRYITFAVGIIAFAITYFFNLKWSFALLSTFIAYILINVASYFYLNFERIWQKTQKSS